VKARKAGASTAAATRPARQEFRLDDGTKVVVTGPAAATPEALVAGLKRVLKQAQDRARAEAPPPADHGQAA
jgi:hypothetical protein